jgi:IS30 family transposase
MASVYRGMTDERKACIWQLWQQGVSMSVIARDIAKPPATVYSYFLYHGGIKPRQRSRRPGCLSLEECEMISRGLAGCKSLRRISRELGRAASTISRKIARNGGPDKHRACPAEKAFLKHSRYPKLTLLSQDEELRGVVTKLWRLIGRQNR